MSETCRGHLCDKIIIKLFASSWYIFLTYIYDARSHLHQNCVFIFFIYTNKQQRHNATNFECCPSILYKSYMDLYTYNRTYLIVQEVLITLNGAKVIIRFEFPKGDPRIFLPNLSKFDPQNCTVPRP